MGTSDGEADPETDGCKGKADDEKDTGDSALV